MSSRRHERGYLVSCARAALDCPHKRSDCYVSTFGLRHTARVHRHLAATGAFAIALLVGACSTTSARPGGSEALASPAVSSPSIMPSGSDTEPVQTPIEFASTQAQCGPELVFLFCPTPAPPGLEADVAKMVGAATVSEDRLSLHDPDNIYGLAIHTGDFTGRCSTQQEIDEVNATVADAGGSGRFAVHEPTRRETIRGDSQGTTCSTSVVADGIEVHSTRAFWREGDVAVMVEVSGPTERYETRPLLEAIKRWASCPQWQTSSTCQFS